MLFYSFLGIQFIAGSRKVGGKLSLRRTSNWKICATEQTIYPGANADSAHFARIIEFVLETRDVQNRLTATRLSLCDLRRLVWQFENLVPPRR